MAQSDPIQEFIDLPRDQQMQTLQQLSPEKQNKLLGQIKQRRATTTTPTASRTSRTLSEAAGGFGRGLLNVAEGLVGPEIQAYQNIRHPIQSAQDMQAQGDAAADAIKNAYHTTGTFRQRDAATELAILENLPIVGGLVQHAEQGGTQLASPEGVGAAIEGITTIAAPEFAGKAVANIGQLRELAKSNVRGKVRSVGNKVRTAGQQVAGAGRAAVREAVHTAATKAAEDAKQTSVKNREAVEGHADAVRETARGNQQANEEHAYKTLEAHQKADAEHAKAVAEVRRQNDEAMAEHGKKVEKVNQHNATVTKAAEDEKALRGQIASHSQELDTRIQKAKVAAKKANDAEWATVRRKVGDASVSSGDLAGDVRDAERKLAGSQESIKVFRDIISRDSAVEEEEPSGLSERALQQRENAGAMARTREVYPEGTPVKAADFFARYRQELANPQAMTEESANEPVPFRDLHGYYTELGNKLSSGGLEGDVYQAMKALRDNIGKRMQVIADERGAGEDLTQAKKGFQNYMEAFSDSPATKQTVASKVLSETAPDYVKERDQAARLAKVARYDQEIGNVAERVRDAHGRLKELPLGEPKPLPEPPVATPDPNRPDVKLPEPPLPKERPSKPEIKPIEKQTVDTKALREELIRKRARAWGFSGYDAAILTSSVILDPIMHMLGGHGEPFRTGAMGYVGGKLLAQKALGNARVVEWLSKPPAGELEALRKIPGADGVKIIGAITDVAKEAQARGLPVSPAVLALGATQAGQPVKNRKDALSRVAPHPGTHTFSVKDWKSHPENRGKDVNLAIQEAKRQGYSVVQ